jgi:hypothetical protein
LWFDLPPDATLQQQWQLLASTAPSSSSSKPRCSDPALATGAVYSPWCLLQCVQLLQRYAPQVCVHVKAVVATFSAPTCHISRKIKIFCTWC